MIYLRWRCKLKISKNPRSSNTRDPEAKVSARVLRVSAVFHQLAVQAPHLPHLRAKTPVSGDAGVVDLGRGLLASKVQNVLIDAAHQVAITDPVRITTIVGGGIHLAVKIITNDVQEIRGVIKVKRKDLLDLAETTG